VSDELLERLARLQQQMSEQEQLQAQIVQHRMQQTSFLAMIGGLGGSLGQAQPMHPPPHRESIRALFPGSSYVAPETEERVWLPPKRPYITPLDYKPHPLVSFAVIGACSALILAGVASLLIP
jgi:hypothetical protein